MMLRARMHTLLAQSGQELSPWLLVAAAGFVALVALVVVPPLARRKSTATKSVPPQPAQKTPTLSGSSSGEHRAIERDIQELMRELAEMTKRATAQFDSRAARLEALIREADQRLAKLANAAERSDFATPAVTTRPTMTTIAEPVVTSTPLPPPSEENVDPRHVEIYTLCEQGLSVPQIADRLRRPSGEIELIIALRPRKRAQAMSTSET